MTEGNLRTIHVFPSQDSYETNQGSVGADDLALIPVDILPTGAVIPFAGSTTPSGYLLCNGATVSRTTYSKLYSAIGTTYGSGDGSTTFNLPNLTNKFIQGSNTAGTVKSAGLPNITGYAGWNQNGKDYNFGDAFKSSTHMAGADVGRGSSTGVWKLNFDASESNAIYGASSTVQPPALTMRYIIKY